MATDTPNGRQPDASSKEEIDKKYNALNPALLEKCQEIWSHQKNPFLLPIHLQTWGEGVLMRHLNVTLDQVKFMEPMMVDTETEGAEKPSILCPFKVQMPEGEKFWIVAFEKMPDGRLDLAFGTKVIDYTERYQELEKLNTAEKRKKISNHLRLVPKSEE